MKWYEQLWLFHRRAVICAVSPILVCAAALVLFCVGRSEPAQTPAETADQWVNDDYLYEPTPVEQVPAGYIPFEDAVKEGAAILFYRFFETHLFADDEDGEIIDCWPVYGSDVIVSCENAYYINQALHEDILSKARLRSEEYNRVHFIGEPVTLRRAQPHYIVRCRYTVIITSVDHNRIYVKLTNEGNYSFALADFLDHVVTTKGTVITEFHWDVENGVRVDLEPEASVHKIVLRIPGTNVMRTILAEKDPREQKYV